METSIEEGHTQGHVYAQLNQVTKRDASLIFAESCEVRGLLV